MKKIFRIRKQDRIYDAFYGDNYEALDDDNSLLADGFEYEMNINTPLNLLWLTFYDWGSIPRDLVRINKINSHGDYVIGKIIDNNVRICRIDERNRCFEIAAENLKEIWLKYEEFESKNADEIILERVGNHFSIQGIWFDQDEKNEILKKDDSANK